MKYLKLTIYVLKLFKTLWHFLINFAKYMSYVISTFAGALNEWKLLLCVYVFKIDYLCHEILEIDYLYSKLF
jgi:hypothetical protein